MGTKVLFISNTTVTLNEGQDNPHWYQNVELNDLYHHAKFEKEFL